MAIFYCKSSMFFLLAITTLFICSSYANYNDVPHTRIGDRKLLGPVDSVVKLWIKAGGQFLGKFKFPRGGFMKGVKTGIRIDKARNKMEKTCAGIYNCSTTDRLRAGCKIYHCVYSIINPQNCKQVCGSEPPPNCYYDDQKRYFPCN